MSLKAVVGDFEELGCRQCRLGIVEMPEGYALMLNGDQTHYFWVNDLGEESVICWNKWMVYRGAKGHAELRARLSA